MELIFRGKEIIFDNKELTILDRTVIDFLSYINVKYVVVSGYVTIFFGRSRNTEDIDLFIERLGYDGFSKLFRRIIGSQKYYCINADNPKDAYAILEEQSSIRFAVLGTLEPNFEIKFPRNKLNTYSLEHPLTVKLNKKHEIKIGPIELQLAYKLYLGGEKDYLDAAHLYETFFEHIDKEKLKSFLKELNIKESLAKRIFGDKYEG